MQSIASIQPLSLLGIEVPPIGIHTAPLAFHIFYVKTGLVPVHDTLQGTNGMQVVPDRNNLQTVRIVSPQRISHVKIHDRLLPLCLQAASHKGEQQEQNATQFPIFSFQFSIFYLQFTDCRFQTQRYDISMNCASELATIFTGKSVLYNKCKCNIYAYNM